jgi:hypothetical protein
MKNFIKHALFFFVAHIPLGLSANIIHKLSAEAQLQEKTIKFDVVIEALDKTYVNAIIDHEAGVSEKIKISFLNKNGEPFFIAQELRDLHVFRQGPIINSILYKPKQIILFTDERKTYFSRCETHGLSVWGIYSMRLSFPIRDDENFVIADLDSFWTKMASRWNSDKSFWEDPSVKEGKSLRVHYQACDSTCKKINIPVYLEIEYGRPTREYPLGSRFSLLLLHMSSLNCGEKNNSFLTKR